MAEVFVQEFSTPRAVELYRKVAGILGVDPSGDPNTGDWPEPLVSHVAGESGDKLIVVEVWESQEAQAEFMNSQLLPAFQEANVPQPTRVEWLTYAGGYFRG